MRSRMGWSASRHSEPGRTMDLFDRRLARLRGVVGRGEGTARNTRAAELLRRAALALIKARRALTAEYPERDPEGRQSRNLGEEEERWRILSTDAIVQAYGRSDT